MAKYRPRQRQIAHRLLRDISRRRSRPRRREVTIASCFRFGVARRVNLSTRQGNKLRLTVPSCPFLRATLPDGISRIAKTAVVCMSSRLDEHRGTKE
ncbi:MAG: hypothetical protein GEU83_19615 [Pseudonocardiaceae bacterium]|nr:hypothetical protein [Pseudonocardiaceae bacterium]